MVDVKISIIGAGSAVFSLNLIKDLCLTPNLQGSTISFMDTNRERLDAVHALCSRYANEMRVKLKLEKTNDRRQSLQGANFIINTALAAGHDKLREGWSIARKHGYRFGGSYHIMHDEAFWINFYQFRLFDSVTRDVMDICKDAWYIQLANPVLAGITYLNRKYQTLKSVGLCHGFTGIYRIAEVLGLEKRHLNFQIPGVNHFVWLTDFYYKGEDAFPILDDWIEKGASSYWEKCYPSSELGPKAVDLYHRFGVFPIGDTCTPGGGTWPWWYHTGDETERRWKEDPGRWWDEYFTAGQRQMEQLISLSRNPSEKVTNVFAPKKSEEITVPLVESLACDIPRVFPINIQNSGGFVTGVPTNFEVEIPGQVSKVGVQGVKTQGLPTPLVPIILRERVAPVEVELEAYARGSRELLLQLILSDPWTKSKEQAEGLLQDILALPYHRDMQQHYK
jgi:alpha-galactosidase